MHLGTNYVDHLDFLESEEDLNSYNAELYAIEIFSIGIFFTWECTAIYCLVRHVIHPGWYPEEMAIPFAEIV